MCIAGSVANVYYYSVLSYVAQARDCYIVVTVVTLNFGSVPYRRALIVGQVNFNSERSRNCRHWWVMSR